MPKRGLPDTLRMRHDAHYVETLAASAATPVGRMVPIEQVDPNPDQPRQAMGDLSELIASIAEKGIIEPLIVRQRGDALPDRRRRAPLPGRGRAGLNELPVVLRDVDDAEMLEDRPGREHPAQGPDAVRRGRGPPEPRRAVRATPTRTSPSAWASRARRLPRRCRSTPSRPTSGSSAGWRTSAASRASCRLPGRPTRRR